MATAVLPTTATFSQHDIDALVDLSARFIATLDADKRNRRERLAIIIEGFRLFQSYDGYSSEAARAIYGHQQITADVPDASKAAIAITGENPTREPDPDERNLMYGRIRTVGGILMQLEDDLDAGVIALDTSTDQVIALVHEKGGWRKYGEQGIAQQEEAETAAAALAAKRGREHPASSASKRLRESEPTQVNPAEPEADISADGQRAPDGAQEQPAAAKPPKATADELVPFDLAAWRQMIEQTGITATPTIPIIAAVPKVAFFCGSNEADIALMPLADLPVDLIKELQTYRPEPDEHTQAQIRGWGYVTAALQLFDRVDSSVPVDADVEAYAGQDMKPSLPGIICDDARHFCISASRQQVGMVVSAELNFPIITGKDGLEPRHSWIHGTGTNSLIRNLSTADQRAAYWNPELSIGSDGSLKVKFRVRGTAVTDRKDFTVAVNPIAAVPPGYWLLRIKPDHRAAGTGMFSGDLASHVDLLKFAAAAGAAKSLKKTVKVALRAKELTLALGSSKKNAMQACAVEGEAIGCEVRAQDFARAIGFGQAIRASELKLGIDKNGLLAIDFSVDAVGDFKIGIPTLRDGVRERAVLERVPD